MVMELVPWWRVGSILKEAALPRPSSYSMYVYLLKVRECLLPSRGVGVSGCSGPAEAEETCSLEACPDWTPWTEWTSCSASCGGGVKPSRHYLQSNLLLPFFGALGSVLATTGPSQPRGHRSNL